MHSASSWASLPPSAAFLVPVVYVATGLSVPGRGALRMAHIASGVAFAIACVVGAGVAASDDASALFSAVHVWMDAASALMLLLVTFMGWIIARYSATALRGEPGQQRYARWLMFTLGSVSVLVLSGHLVVMALAWTSASLALHQLLTFYEDRQQAIIAAHKKFILSRAADLCVFGALAALSMYSGLRVDEVRAFATSADTLPVGAEVAAVLLVIGVALRSAQLPFHGWLVQVMEAPTPVSALLHAGIVNIGGFVLIRLSPLVGQSAAASALLVAIGASTAVCAALIMATRNSVKVRLAWSTCAQMGLMLLQCGLGAPSMALLHLVAHSLYKAHAFLASGRTVTAWRVRHMTPVRTVSRGALLGWAAAAVIVVTRFMAGPLGLDAVVVVGLAAAAIAGGAYSVRVQLVCLAGAAIVAGAHAGLHDAFALLVGADSLGPAATVIALWIAFASLAVAQRRLSTVADTSPGGLLSSLQRGLFLDELLTRLTFRIWPPRLPRQATSRAPLGAPLTEA